MAKENKQEHMKVSIGTEDEKQVSVIELQNRIKKLDGYIFKIDKRITQRQEQLESLFNLNKKDEAALNKSLKYFDLDNDKTQV